jgi:ribA/ribD-fused uncharacterized protein
VRKFAAIRQFVGRYRFLSNFQPLHEITAEHIFQAMKTRDCHQQIWVLMAPTPGEAKRRGQRVTLRDDWDNIRLDVMEYLLRLKFSDPTMRTSLLETGEAELVEGNNWGDNYWGSTHSSAGRNYLGKILMKIRHDLQEGR